MSLIGKQFHYWTVKSKDLSKKRYWICRCKCGIDRLNNDKGYTVENIVSCCSICNKAKSNLTMEEFLAWIERIKIHNVCVKN